MFLRTSSSLLPPVVAFALLSACGNETPAPEGETLDCAIGSAVEFDSVCTLEWVGEAWTKDFLIHHPGGGFRRFSINEDATGVIVSDGAREVVMVDTGADGFWQFAVGEDRYRMPPPPLPEV